MSNRVMYPDMRAELVDGLKTIADGDAVHLDYAIHFLFDDSSLSSDPRRTLGAFLRNEREMNAVVRVVQLMDAILFKYGTSVPNQTYVTAPEWHELAEAAKRALDVLAE